MQGWAGRWPLVARKSLLDSFEEDLASGNTYAWMICGSAGVGKTRLADEFVDVAASSGRHTVRAVASKAAAQVPLGAIAHLLPSEVDLSDPVSGFRSVARALTEPAGKPRVVFVDDMHLLDSSSAVLLGQLLDSRTVTLVGTVRSGEHVSEAVDALLQRGDRVRRIDLSPMDRIQVAELLQRVLGAPVSQRALHTLFSASGGNVLFLRELVLGSMATGALQPNGEVWEIREKRLPVTPHLKDLVTTRISMAPATARPLLETVAFCGTLSLTDALSTLDRAVLVELEESGIIRVNADGRRMTVTLAHPLYGEVIAAGVSAVQRYDLMLRMAERMEAHGLKRRADALHVASCRLAATGTADPGLLRQAAAIAMNSNDNEQAIELLTAVKPDQHTLESRLMLGRALMHTGQLEQAETTLADAEAHAQSDREKVTAAAIRSANLFWSSPRPDEGLAVCSAARRTVTSTTARQQLCQIEGFMHVASGAPEAGLLALDTLAEVPPAEGLEVWLLAVHTKAVGLAIIGRVTQARALAEYAVTVHQAVGVGALLPDPAIQTAALTLALAEDGAIGQAHLASLNASDTLSTVHSPITRTRLAAHTGRVEWLAGRPRSARRWYAEAAATARSYRVTRMMRFYLAGLLASAALTGDLNAADAIVRDLETYPSSGYMASEESLGTAWLYAARGELSRAREVLLGAAADARRTRHVISEAVLLTDIARLGDPRSVCQRLAELASDCDGAFTRARADFVVALAAGDPGQLMSCSHDLERMGATLLAAESAAAAAQAWKQCGESRKATAATARAAALAAQCEGARTPLLSGLASTSGSLTRREQEIALMAAAGNTSKAISERLTLSVRTVSNHLQRVYLKLGVRNRAELVEALRYHTDQSSTKTGTAPTLSQRVGR